MKLVNLWARNAQNAGNSLNNIQPPNPSFPDIPAPGGPDNAAGTGLVAASSMPTTSTPSNRPTSTPSSATSAAASATSSTKPAAAHGLTQPKLIAAIAVPVGIIALLIPILILWYLDRRRTKQAVLAEKRASQRSSGRSAKAWEPLPVVEKEYRGQAPARPRSAEPIPTRKPVPEGAIPDKAPQIPSSTVTSSSPERSSLGLFNFELSPASTPRSRGSIASPRWRLSIARALELRRSEVAVTQVPGRQSGGSEHRPNTAGSTRGPTRPTSQQPQIQVQAPDNHQSVVSASSLYVDPPPPYITPRPSEAQAQISHYAPLERIGTQQQAARDRVNRLSTSHIVGQLNRGSLAADPQRTTYASSGLMPDTEDDDSEQRLSHTPSTPSSEGRMSAHNNGPFTYDFPERLSGISQLSFDETQWGADGQRRSGTSEVSAMDSSESSTHHPHQII